MSDTYWNYVGRYRAEGYGHPMQDRQATYDKREAAVKIKIATLHKVAKAIYQVEYPDDEIEFERLSPNTKDSYLRMAKAAADAIDRDYPLQRASASAE